MTRRLKKIVRAQIVSVMTRMKMEFKVVEEYELILVKVSNLLERE